MKILLVYPKYPDTFWSFSHAVRFVARKAAHPPLGLITVAAMLPSSWERRLVDMNVTELMDRDLAWADYVFVSAMIVQKPSAQEVVERCRRMGVSTVGGGPLFTSNPDAVPGIDHVVMGEAETSLPSFIADVSGGRADHRYQVSERPDMAVSPRPQWELLNRRHYVSMAVQYSRGCPFQCEFCDIIVMNGRVPRAKEARQLLGEFDALYEWGWRGPVFIVDDNFIGNRTKVTLLLKDVAVWMREHGHPFSLFTEASLNLGEDEELLGLMAGAGFNKVFIGLETPEDASLAECSKNQNRSRNPRELVKRIQNHGMEVLGGFILGFDNDPPSIFERQIQFIQDLGVVTAMVGLLNALPGTRLYDRLRKEGRLLAESLGDNVNTALNFIPKMDSGRLVDGYQHVLSTIYSTKAYYERIHTFLKEYRPRRRPPLSLQDLLAFPRSALRLGLLRKGRCQYWKLILTCLFRKPRVLPEAITLAIIGYHFQRVMESLEKREASVNLPQSA